jgi:hypothetical protein
MTTATTTTTIAADPSTSNDVRRRGELYRIWDGIWWEERSWKAPVAEGGGRIGSCERDGSLARMFD